MSLHTRRTLTLALIGTALAAVPAYGQSADPAPPATPTPAPPAVRVPPPPAGGYYMADGTRTADHAAALASWRADKQFTVDYSKRYLGLEHAYVLGLSGRGRTIGINDSGLAAGHPSFAGDKKWTGFHTGAPEGFGDDGVVNPRIPYQIHGTHVAGIAAANRTADGVMFGNAYDADLLIATINFAAGDPLYFAYDLADEEVGDPRRALVDMAGTGKVRIINNSWGIANQIPYDAPVADIRARLVRSVGDFYRPVIDNDVLVVRSAGNDAERHAGLDATIPLGDPRLRSYWLSVTNYDANDRQAGSSLCGQTATWCVSAPGAAILSSVSEYKVDVAGIRAKYAPRNYRMIYLAERTNRAVIAATVGTLKAAVDDFVKRRDAAATAGLTIDLDAEREQLARTMVGAALTAIAQFDNNPDGFTTELASYLASDAVVGTLGRQFAVNLLIRSDELLRTELSQFVPFQKFGYAPLSGTSMAAPNVSGFAALLMQAFPAYNTPLISDILVSSGRDIEDPGVDLRAGWGVPQMNVALRGPSALRQVRDVTVPEGVVDTWSNDIQDARDVYSPDVLKQFPDDIGGIVKLGAGELVMTGTNRYSGATRVRAGLLSVDGSLTRSALSVADAGTVGGNGTLAALDAQAGGTVSPGSVGAIGTLTVAGTATFAPGSSYLVDVAADGTADRLDVGRAVLAGGTVGLRTGDRLPRYGDGYAILSARDGVTGQFDGGTAFSAILYPELAYTAGGVTARVAAHSYATVVEDAPTQHAYARLLDANRPPLAAPPAADRAADVGVLEAGRTAVAGPRADDRTADTGMQGLYAALDLQRPAVISAALEAIAPRAETTRRAIGTVTLDNAARFYRDRIAGLAPDRLAGGTVTTIGRPLDYAATAIAAPAQVDQVGDTPLVDQREQAAPDGVAVYLAGGYVDGSSAPMRGNLVTGGRDRFDGYYVAGGVEAALTDTAALGFGLLYSKVRGDRQFDQSASGELVQGTLYGRLGDTAGPALDVQFGGGRFRSTTRRAGDFVGTPFDLRARDNALALSAEVGASYATAGAIRLAPRVAIRASQIGFTSNVERGTGPALVTDAQRLRSLQGRAGAAVETGSAALRLHATGYFVHDFERQPGAFLGGFDGGTLLRTSFLTAAQDRNWGEVGGGLSYTTGRATLSLAADTTIGRRDVRNQSYRAGVKVAF